MSWCETKVVDEKEAEFLLRTATFALQRPLSESNVIRLEAEMRTGRFVPGTPLYFGVLPDRTPVSLNGQHTLNAIKRCGRPIELTFVHQDVADMTEAAAIYSRLDLHKTRSWRDSLRAYGSEKMLCDSTKWTSVYASALGFLFEKFKVARTDKENQLARIQGLRSRDVRHRAMNESIVPATHYVQAVQPYPADLRLYQRATVMAVGIEIFRYDAARAHTFFSSLAADDGLRAGQPQRALLRYLREHNAAGAVAREAQAKAVAIAWNAFDANKELATIKPGAMDALRLNATPWVDKDFDPLRRYLPDLFSQEELPLEHAPPAPAPKGRRRRIVGGVNAATNEPMASVEPETEPAAAE